MDTRSRPSPRIFSITTSLKLNNQTHKQPETPKIWNASDNLDLNQLGLRSAKSQTDLQGFSPYEGMDPLVPI